MIQVVGSAWSDFARKRDGLAIPRGAQFPLVTIRATRKCPPDMLPDRLNLRKQMVESVFGSSVTVLPDYAFHAPYSKYLPPLLSRRSWELRRQITAKVEEGRFVSYTGDAAERLMLRVYRLNPLKANRLELSASSVKDIFYRQAIEGATSSDEWHDKVPGPVVEVIKKNWQVVEKFARMDDGTKRVLGMKFPRDGYTATRTKRCARAWHCSTTSSSTRGCGSPSAPTHPTR